MYLVLLYRLVDTSVCQESMHLTYVVLACKVVDVDPFILQVVMVCKVVDVVLCQE